MNKYLVLSSLIFFYVTAIGQKNNYVLNPSFEEHDSCPALTDGGIFLLQCTYWNSPDEGSSDYFHPCSSNPQWSTPMNYFGGQIPHTGQAYSGAYGYYSSTPTFDSREYIQGQFKDTLTKNLFYIFRSYISVADDTLANKFCIDNFGIYLSDTPIHYTGWYGTLPFMPYYKNPIGNVLDTKEGWQLIEGSFKANGGEKYIILGNFDTDTDVNVYDCNGTGFVKGNEGVTYIYIDDVAVYDTSEIDTMSICIGDSIKLDAAWVKQSGMYTKIIAGLPTHVFVVTVDCDTLDYDCKLALPDVFSPNADGLNDEWKPLIQTTCIDHISNYLLRIYDRWGALIFTAYDKEATWQGINNQIGTYVYYLQYDELSSAGELNTKILQGSVELIR